jgi:glycosyltransferase involved in cell wall biosynthesis
MVPYKRLDVAIRACNRLGYPLVLAGAGPEEAALRALADRLRADVRFVVGPDDRRLRELYRAADLLVFPAEEDFGIVPVEAQACGTPVVALARGGTVETVVPGVTGVLVDDQDDESFAEGIAMLSNRRSDPAACRRNAERFSTETFEAHFADWVVAAAAARGISLADPRRREGV